MQKKVINRNIINIITKSILIINIMTKNIIIFLWNFLTNRPFAQPLGNIREYFGEKVALYFSWLGFYTVYLLFPAFFGVFMMIVFRIRGYEYTKDHLDYFLITFLVLIVIWSTVYKQGWDREEKAIAMKWGEICANY